MANTYSKISVLVPTRHRVHRLKTLLASWQETVRDKEQAELVFRVDDDDVETLGFLEDLPHKVVSGSRRQGYRSMPSFFNELFMYASTGDVLMCGNDDMAFRTVGWPAMVLAAANEYPDGLFDFGVSTLNETHYPFSIVSRRAASQMGFLWDPRVYWGDVFLRDVMAAFGRTIMLPSVHVEHDWVGQNPDQVFRESEKNVQKIDPVYWTETHPRLVGEAVSKLRELSA